MNLSATTFSSSLNSDSATECGNCAAKSQHCFFLHHVRLRGIYRRLCTSCVLLLHPSSFCPSCFAFYDSTPPPPSKRLACSKCSSFTHSHCLLPSPPPPHSFLCPPCSKPNFTFFRVDPDVKLIDKNMAAVLLCAARIASASMAKAVTVSRAESERRAREAALCRKRAREALEHVCLLATNNNNKEKLLMRKRKDEATATPTVTNTNNNGHVNDNFGLPNSNSNVRVKEEGIDSFLPN